MNIQVGAELGYFQQEFGASFERTYGWAWLLKLQEELEASAQVWFQSNKLSKLANTYLTKGKLNGFKISS